MSDCLIIYSISIVFRCLLYIAYVCFFSLYQLAMNKVARNINALGIYCWLRFIYTHYPCSRHVNTARKHGSLTRVMCMNLYSAVQSGGYGVRLSIRKPRVRLPAMPFRQQPWASYSRTCASIAKQY